MNRPSLRFIVFLLLASGSCCAFGQTHGQGDANGDKLAPFGVPGGSGGVGPKVSFGGASLNAMKVILICDASSKTSDFDQVREEQRAFVDRLKPILSFNLIRTQGAKAVAISEKSLLLAVPESKVKAYHFIDKASSNGAGDPTAAIKLAFEMQPQAVILASTGDWKDAEAVATLVKELNKDKRVFVYLVSLVKEPQDSDKVLANIAQENGGKFVKFAYAEKDSKK